MPWSMKLSLRKKLSLLIFVLFATFITATALSFFYHIDNIYEKRKQVMLQEKKQDIIEKINIVHHLVSSIYRYSSNPENIERVYREKILAVIDSTLSIITKQYELLKKQGLADNQIQQRLKTILRDLRYDEGGGGYVFTYDFKGTLISHPDNALDGKNLYNLQDAKGFYITRAMLNVVRTSEEGFVHYYWRKLGHEEPKQKISYVKLFKPYNWILGTGVYIEDTQELLKQQIASLLTTYRYDLGKTKNNYLFVMNDKGIQIRNPASPQMNGKNLFNTRDIKGKLFAQEIIQVIKEKKQGFIKYHWPKPNNPDIISEKLTFVKKIEPFEWIIGTGIYLEDSGIKEMEEALEQEARYIIWTSALAGFIFLVIGSLMSIKLVNIVIEPLIEARHVADRIAKGDFSKQTTYHSNDEIGELSLSINMMAKQLQESFNHLISLNKEKDEFLGIAAHDLKNPLQAIQGSAELIRISLEEEPFDNKREVIEFANMINVSAERMFDLITNLLDVNIIETGGLKVNLKTLDILPLLEEIVDEYRQKAETKGITVHFTPEADSYHIHTDIYIMHQILDNLISNAVKYSSLGKHIFIRIFMQNQQVRIEIQDQGIGFSQEDQAKLFGKFTRLTAKPTGGEHSTGLGLFIVKKLVTALKGEIWCKSSFGQGATFILTIPENIEHSD